MLFEIVAIMIYYYYCYYCIHTNKGAKTHTGIRMSGIGIASASWCLHAVVAF